MPATRPEVRRLTEPNQREALRSLGTEGLLDLIFGEPKLKSPATGHGAEMLHLRDIVETDTDYYDVEKPSTSGRDSKIDLFVGFGGRRFRLQNKSIYMPSVRITEDRITGYVNLDGNSCTRVHGEVTVKTKRLYVPEIDIIVAWLTPLSGVPGDFIYKPSNELLRVGDDPTVPAQFRGDYAKGQQYFTYSGNDDELGWYRNLKDVMRSMLELQPA